MNYIEQLHIGDKFISQEKRYIVTTDFKTNGSRLCVDIVDGTIRWFEPSMIVDSFSVYYLDNDNNIVPLNVKDNSNATHNQIS